MGFAVYHTEKGKGSGGGLGNHIDRTEGKEYSYPHADPSRKELNVKMHLPNKAHEKPLPQAIADRIGEGYNHKRAIRKDAVKHLNHVLTGSHKDMVKIFNEGKQEEWVKENYKFAAKEFGAKNIVRFDLHLDEKTPHIHCVTVPLTEDGRLSAREMMGNKKDMQQRQDRYAEQMKEFGLERGVKGTLVKHENAKEYYKRLDAGLKQSEELDLKPIKGVFGVNKDKTIEKHQELAKSLKIALNESQWRHKEASKSFVQESNEKNKIYEKIQEQNKVLNSPELLQKILLDFERQKEEKKEQKIERKNDRDFGKGMNI